MFGKRMMVALAALAVIYFLMLWLINALNQLGEQVRLGQ